MLPFAFSLSRGCRLLMAASVISLGLGLAATDALAQVGEATGSADPGRFGGPAQDRPIMPDVSPRVEVKDVLPQNAPEGAENIVFTLASIDLEGANAYDSAALQAVYADKIGQSVSLADVYAIANALTNKYRNDGYILTQVVVPPQTIEGGVVKLRVVEGFLGNVTVEGEGEGAPALDLIRSYAAKIKTGGALNARNLERYLLLINDLPGVEARSILSPSANQPGAADLQIIVTRDPYDAVVGVDNFGSRYLGLTEFFAAGALNSALGYNERISAQAVYAPDAGAELLYGAVGYSQPVWSDGTKLEMLASITDTKPGYDLRRFHVEGQSKYFEAKLVRPFVRSRTFNVYGNMGFDIRNVDSENDLETKREDRLRAVRGGTKIEFLDTLMGFGINTVDLQLSKGLGILGASNEGDPNMTRSVGDPQFTKLNAEIQRLQRISSEINLLLAAAGQLSSNALLSSEEFGVGGVNYGRGYDSSEIVGDEGVSGKIELQWDAPYEIPMVYDYQLYTFFDAGRVWNQDAAVSDLEKESLTSTGFGARVDFTERTKGGVGVAFPLTRDVDTRGDTDMRVYLNLQHEF